MRHLSKMVLMTNEKLRMKNFDDAKAQEILKFFGVIILMTRYRVSDRRKLREKSGFRHQKGPSFGDFMARNRFDDLRPCICFSSDVEEGEKGASKAQRRSAPIQDFADESTNIELPKPLLLMSFALMKACLGGMGWEGLGWMWGFRIARRSTGSQKAAAHCALRLAAGVG